MWYLVATFSCKSYAVNNNIADLDSVFNVSKLMEIVSLILHVFRFIYFYIH